MKSEKTCIPDKLLELAIDGYTLIAGLTIEEVRSNEFLDREEAMKLLNCSTTTLQNYRDLHKIEFYQLSSKNILYHKQSIVDFIESTKVTKWK